MQVYSANLGQVVDIVVSHQGVEIKTQLIGQLMSALVLPAPEHYRPLGTLLQGIKRGQRFHPLTVADIRSQVRSAWHLSQACNIARRHGVDIVPSTDCPELTPP